MPAASFKRKTVHAAIAAALFFSVNSGCSDVKSSNSEGGQQTAPSPSAVSKTAPVKGGTLTYGLASSPSGLDPNVVPGAVDYRVMRRRRSDGTKLFPSHIDINESVAEPHTLPMPSQFKGM